MIAPPFARKHIKKTDTDVIIATSIDNVRLALVSLGLRTSFNEFTHQTLVDGVALDDAMVDRIWVRIDDTFHFRPSKDLLRTVLGTEAERTAFHPVRDYLDALQWDGRARVDEWLITYAGARASAYVRAVSPLPLLAAVKRVRQPKCKFDEMLILESAQGTNKSSALRALCADDGWFSDDLPLDATSKEIIERTSGKWIIEAQELHGSRGREAEQLKSFLSRQTDGPVRLAYGHLPVTVNRQFVLIGTTNNGSYLKDATGGRRFWPVRVKQFDLAPLTRDRDQLWAEAATREARGESIRLDAKFWPAASAQQEQRRSAHPWEEILEPFTEWTTVPVERVWSALGFPPDDPRQRDSRNGDKIAEIMSAFGFVKRRPRIDGVAIRSWVKAEHLEDEEAANDPSK